MQSLLDFQSAFAASLLAEPNPDVLRAIAGGRFTSAERLDIHRNSCRSTLVAALRLTYPALARLVGDEFFDYAAGRFAIENPPVGACLNDYGASFVDFLAGFPPASGLAYLPDVARFEWALAHAANVEDSPALSPADLARLDAAALAELRFIAHPSVRLLWLAYPADHICDAVLSGNEEAMREIDLAEGTVRLLVHRGPRGVEAQRLDATDCAWLGALCAGEEWSSLVDRAPERATALLAEQLVKGRLAELRIEHHAEGRS